MRDAAVNALLGDVAALLLQLKAAAGDSLVAHVRDQVLPSLGAEAGVRGPVAEALGVNDAKALKQALRALIQQSPIAPPASRGGSARRRQSPMAGAEAAVEANGMVA